MSANDNALVSASPSPAWAIVLAAGGGSRLARLTRLLYGRDVPKQFAALDGGVTTLLQRTMDRLEPVVPPSRTVVVVARGFEAMARAQLRGYPGVTVVVQPRNLGTGPGMLLPLAHVAAAAPGADVIVTPSDHHFARPAYLADGLRRCIDVARKFPAGIALLGAEPDSEAGDLGWILGQGAPGNEGALIERFVEKPPRGVAARLRGQGALWNTLLCAGSVDSWWRLCEKHLPSQTQAFRTYRDGLAHGRLDSKSRSEQLDQIYQSIEMADLARQVLEKARGLGVVKLSAQAGWSDWGTPERVLACLDGTAALNDLLRRIYEHTKVSGRPGQRAAQPHMM